MTEFYSLSQIISEMIYTRKTRPKAYRRFTSLLISHRKEDVINFVMNAIISCFLPNTPPEEQLIFLSPDTVSSFFVNLCHEYPWIIEQELNHTIAEKRYRMALIFRSLFALKKSLPTLNICRELFKEHMIDVWQTFSKLFTDCEPQIRIVCVQTTEILLQTQMDEKIISNLITNLKKRLRDNEEAIRCDSVMVVNNSSQSEHILNHYLMKYFVSRIGEQVLEVRLEVLLSVSNVFHTLNRKYSKSEPHFLYKLSSGCLLRYTTDYEKEKAFIEMLFRYNLLDLKAGNETMAKNLLKLVCFCDDCGVRSISQLFHTQLKLRTLLLKVIIWTERHEFKISIMNANHKVYERVLKAFEYIDNIDDVLKNFHLVLKACDNRIIEDIKNVFQSKSLMSCQQSMEAIEELFSTEQTVVDDRALKELKDEMTIRLGIGLIDSKALIQLFGHMNDFDITFASRLASFVILLSKCYSHYFNDESVVEVMLGLPQIIISLIASDSMFPYMQCTDSLKERIKNLVEYQSI